MPHPVPPRGDATRAALVAAALKLFGDKGFEAASTREIAAAAEVNIAMIAYHFGGKEGLRAACADFVAERLTLIFASARADRIETAEAGALGVGRARPRDDPRRRRQRSGASR